MILSVIVPVYNGETYLTRCIDSVENAGKYACEFLKEKIASLSENSMITQDNEALEASTNLQKTKAVAAECNFEIILVNDGSTDNTASVCDELIKKYDNIRLLTLTDEGVSVARNKGMALASGQYISFVDADDVVAKDMFSKLLSVAMKEDADIVGCSFYEWSNEEQIKDIELENRKSEKLLMDSSDETEANNLQYEHIRRDLTHKGSVIINDISVKDYRTYDSQSFIFDELLKGNTRCWSKIYKTKLLMDNDIHFQPGLSIGEDMLFLASAVMACGSAYSKEQKESSLDTLKSSLSKAQGDSVGNAHDDKREVSSGIICELKDYKGYGYYKNPAGAINRPFTPKYMDQIYCWEKLSELLNITLEADGDEAGDFQLFAFDDIRTILNSRYIVALMLVASKIAVSGKEAIKLVSEDMASGGNEASDYILIIHNKLIKALKNPHKLDNGYKIKTKIFKLSPALYLKLYGCWKR